MKPGFYEAGGSDCYAQVLSDRPEVISKPGYYKLKINLTYKGSVFPFNQALWYEIPKDRIDHWVKIDYLHS